MFNKLSLDELYIARMMFKLKIHEKNGQNFENLFSHVMRLNNIDFIQVKPQGQFGDRKNDGFIKSTGQYYQVYAPENLLHKEKETIEKLENDFSGLYSYWDKSVTPILEFNFVLNDKYQGTYPTLHPELSKIESNYKGVKCKPFLSQHLEDIFLNLPSQHIIDIVGLIPSAESISLDVSILSVVIQYIISIEESFFSEKFPINPDFEEKIKFNSLSQHVATLLRYGSFQEGALKEYFRLNSTFFKEDLKNTFTQLYNDGNKRIPVSEDKNDIVFFDILNLAFPNSNKKQKDAVLVLMSYFFGYCDIYEEPPLNTKQLSIF